MRSLSVRLSAALTAAGLMHEPLEDGVSLGRLDPLTGCAEWAAWSTATDSSRSVFTATFYGSDCEEPPSVSTEDLDALVAFLAVAVRG